VVALAAQPSTPGDSERDRAVTSPPPANDDRPVMIISATSRKRLRAEHDHDDHADHGDHHHQDIRAWLERAKWGHGRAIRQISV
jgi:hypothetical protein